MEETCGCCTGLIKEGPVFNQRFADYGWCAYDTISEELIHRANRIYEEKGIEEAERVLIEYYRTEALNQAEHILNASPSFAVREDMIRQCFEDHADGRYYASVPLALIIIDGAVNDYTKKKGFFTAATTVDPWDCLVGCTEGLTKIKLNFNQNRLKTNREPIYIPYRNGILHGRDINYGNEYVSCKCIALMFAIADWMVRRSAREEQEGAAGVQEAAGQEDNGQRDREAQKAAANKNRQNRGREGSFGTGNPKHKMERGEGRNDG